MPGAQPPGPINAFNKDLDLPEVDHYTSEVLRYVPGGLRVTVVAQFTVIEPEKSVQVMLVHVGNVGRNHWRATSRDFGQLTWSQYIALRTRALNVIMMPPLEPGKVKTASGLKLCTDGGSGQLSYSSGFYSWQTAVRGGCSDEVYQMGQEIIHAAENAIGGP